MLGALVFEPVRETKWSEEVIERYSFSIYVWWMDGCNGMSTVLYDCCKCTLAHAQAHTHRFQYDVRCDAMRLEWIENFSMGPRMIVCLFAHLAVSLTSMCATPSIWHCSCTSTLWISTNFHWCTAHTTDDTSQYSLQFVRLWNISHSHWQLIRRRWLWATIYLENVLSSTFYHLVWRLEEWIIFFYCFRELANGWTNKQTMHRGMPIISQLNHFHLSRTTIF